jgi:hypothetical protein
MLAGGKQGGKSAGTRGLMDRVTTSVTRVGSDAKMRIVPDFVAARSSVKRARQ